LFRHLYGGTESHQILSRKPAASGQVFKLRNLETGSRKSDDYTATVARKNTRILDISLRKKYVMLRAKFK
jgi:hypothetical protein